MGHADALALVKQGLKHTLVRSRVESIIGYRRLRHTKTRLPAFLVIGAQKSGTTSFFRYLSQHPEIIQPVVKETHYFTKYKHRSVAWYSAHFAGPSAEGCGISSMVAGEATPYYLFHPDVPSLVHALLPEVQLIVLLRNPIDRAYSHYQHERRRGREHLSFSQAIDAELGAGPRPGSVLRRPVVNEHQSYSYLSRGYYAEQLSRWFSVFPSERFLILGYEEFFSDPSPFLAGVEQFLGLGKHRYSLASKHNVGSYVELPIDLRERLASHFAPHNRELDRLLGRSFEWE